tara:strand:- start:162794 stop:163945 length:1152 start_codon:yes stop_codon:yes gene_type:complete
MHCKRLFKDKFLALPACFLFSAVIGCGSAATPKSSVASPTSVAEDTEGESERVPLSAEEEKGIVGLVQAIHSESPPEEEEIIRAAERITGAPGITVILCADALMPILENDIDAPLLAVQLVASAAQLIETPEIANTLPLMTTKAMAATLRAYQHASTRLGKTDPNLEELVSLERSGSLGEHILKNWSTCPTSVAMQQAIEDEGFSLAMVPDVSANTGARPWGAEVPNSEVETKVMNDLRSIAAGDSDSKGLSDVSIAGAALYQALLEADRIGGRSELATLGTPSTSIISTGDGVTKMPMRTYRSEHRSALLRSASFLQILALIADGQARPATEAERKFWYALIPFEINGQPVTVVEASGHRLVVYLDEDGAIFWMDLLSGYER